MAAWLAPVRLSTTAAISETLGTPDTPTAVDGAPVVEGDRILLKDQIDPTHNGVWVAGDPGVETMTRALDVLERESVVRVVEGLANARTEWSLRAPEEVDVPNTEIYFERDVTTHAFDTIEAMKTFPATGGLQVDDVGNLAGFYAPGDGGGGAFTYVGPADFARIVSADVVEVDVDSIANSVGPLGTVTITTVADHGLYPGAFPAGIPHLPAAVYLDGDLTYGIFDHPLVGPVSVIPTSTTTLDLVGLVYNVVLGGGGATVKYVKVTTAAAHGRSPGERMSVAGVDPAGGAFDINGAHFACGVIEQPYVGSLQDPPVDVTLPLPTTAGTYVPQPAAVLGNEATIVTTADAAGVARGVWQRDVVSPANPRWWGAKLDADQDDLPFLQSMQASLPEKGGRIAWPEGVAWLSDTFVVSKSLSLEGAGGTQALLSGIEVAPVRTAITVVQSNCAISNLEIRSRIPFNTQLYVESGLSAGFEQGPAAERIRKGDCYVIQDAPDPGETEIYFRALNAGTFAGEPAVWAMMAVGDIATENDVTWVAEPFPVLRENDTEYAVGDRIWVPDDRELELPLPEIDGASYTRVIRNKCSMNGKTISIKTDGGTQVDLTTTGTLIIGVEPAGVYPITALL